MRHRVGLNTGLNPITSQTIVQVKSMRSLRPRLAGRTRIRRTKKQVTDLRLHKEPTLANQLAPRIGFLPPADRILLEQVYIQGWPVARVAALTGEPPRKVRRRAKRLATRALKPVFLEVALHSDGWPRDMRAVGAAVFIRGLSIRAAAAELSLSYGSATLHARTIRALVKTPKTEINRNRGAA
jgi:hypothetical protein